MKRYLIAITLLLCAHAAWAGEPADDGGSHVYYTIGATSLVATTYDCSCNASWNLGALSGSVGWQPNRYLAIEATGLAGVVDGSDQGVTMKFSSGFLASVLPMVPVSAWVSIYGRAAYAHTKLTADNGMEFGSSSGNSGAFGLGVQVLQPTGSSRLGARLEATHYLSRDNVRVRGVTLAFMQRF
jgi:hypothetical protein